jgi:mRNA-degrading endonuclease HigB of HigAB toxin-antitoxin module
MPSSRCEPGSRSSRRQNGLIRRPPNGMFGSADTLRDGRVVFDVGGNKYRLVAWVNYQYRIVHVHFIGTHRDYDKIDAQSV